MGRVQIDGYTRCSCGHIRAHHHPDWPAPCRMGSCECEGFYLLRGSRVIAVPAPDPRPS